MAARTEQANGDSRDIDALVDAVLTASRALVAISARSIAGAQGVTLPQYRMLVVLDQSPSNLTGLAAALDVAPSTAMRMIDRLIAAGLVERSIPEENRRETHLALTSSGRRTVGTVTARRRRDLQSIMQAISPAERGQVAQAMQTFADAAGRLGVSGDRA